MKDFIKEWGRVCLGSVAAAGLGATSFFAVEALMPQPADAKLDKEFTRGLEICTATRKVFVSHEQGYRDGKFLAQIINEVSQKGFAGVSAAETVNYHLRKRSNFPAVAAVYLQRQGESELAGCSMVRWDPISKQAWSSVHSALTDYLIPSLKQHFLSIPER